MTRSSRRMKLFCGNAAIVVIFTKALKLRRFALLVSIRRLILNFTVRPIDLLLR
jgi:hypothetical protein